MLISCAPIAAAASPRGGLTQVDTASMDAFIKSERRTRNDYVTQRGQAEFDKAKREAKTDSVDKRAKLTAELSGPAKPTSPDDGPISPRTASVVGSR